MSSVDGVVVWSDDLPSEDVIVGQKIDVTFSGVGVGGDGESVESVVGSREDYVPSVSLTFIKCIQLSDGDVVSHDLGSLFSRVDLLVCYAGKTLDGVHHGHFKVWVVGVCGSEDSGISGRFWACRGFLYSRCGHSVNCTFSHFDSGFNGPVMSRT